MIKDQSHCCDKKYFYTLYDEIAMKKKDWGIDNNGVIIISIRDTPIIFQ
jgi:hypothetical protein